ncbi:MAG: M4 family metallopeptidase [Candidatus Binatia bacterium]
MARRGRWVLLALGVVAAVALVAGHPAAAPSGLPAAIHLVPLGVGSAAAVATGAPAARPDPVVALAGARLRERVAALRAAARLTPAQHAGLATLSSRTGARPTLRVRPGAGTPRWLAGAVLEPASRGWPAWGDGAQRTARAFLRRNRALLRLDDPDGELALVGRTDDALGRTHLRFVQRHRGLAVWPAEVVVHLDPDGNVDGLHGAFVPTPDIDPTPAVTAAAAGAVARDAVPAGAAVAAVELVVHAPGDRPPRLAWRIALVRGLEGRWLVFVDTRDGAVLTTIDLVMREGALGSGVDLGGTERGLGVWEEGGTYFLVDTSKPMFDAASDPPDPGTTRGGIVVLDARDQNPDADGHIALEHVTSATPWFPGPADAVSAAFGLSRTYDYFRARHGRESLDGQGSTMIGIVRFGRDLANAFWNGTVMVFGDALPYAGALDVVAHELTHGVTQHTANLVYQNEPGALNEAMSDIFGEAVEADVLGAPDWVVGAALGQPLRDLAHPGARTIGDTGRPFPARYSELIDPADPFLDRFTGRDNGGVHLNSGIINRAFYLLAEPTEGGIGIVDAARIFYRALAVYLVANAQFVDARLAAVRAAEDLFGPGSAAAVRVAAAFDAVEVVDGSSTPPPDPFPGTAGADALVFVDGSAGGGFVLARREEALGDPAAGVRLGRAAAAWRRPAVSGDGALVAFVSADRDVCLARTDGGGEACLGLPGRISSVAMSPDGARVALVLLDDAGNPTDRIEIVDVDSGATQTFPLRAPALDGGGLDTVLFAASMDFTADGRLLLYDAFNAITLTDGTGTGVWSIYALDLVGDTTLVVLPPTPGFDVAYPSLSQTSDNFLVFDLFSQETQTSTIVTGNLTTGELRAVGTSVIGAPGYTGDDRAVVFNPAGASAGGALVRQALASDRMTPVGQPTVLLAHGALAAVYRRGTFTGPVPSTTTTTTLAPTTSTTTTTRPPASLCAGDAACADGDPCTADACDPQVGCVYVPLAGVARDTCALGDPALAAACRGDRGFARVAARLARVRTAIEQADRATRPVAARRFLRRARAGLASAVHRARRLAGHGDLSGTCTELVVRVVRQTRTRVDARLLRGR